MASINASSGQGALFELVARGVKDTYFVKDDPESVFPYDASYHSAIHHLAERRTMIPVNRTDFGGKFEVEIDTYGDVMTECALEINLPTWLPPLLHQGQMVDPSVVNRLYSIRAINGGRSFGYVNAVAYFLFERIQVYQDQIMIQEWSGDGLYAKDLNEGSWNQGYLSQLMAGSNIYTEDINGRRAIELRATPDRLRICLPLPGMQSAGDRGLPLCAISWQKFRIRATLRRLEDLIVSSDPNFITKPAPWSESGFSYTDVDGVSHIITPLKREEITAPVIHLSTIQHYLPEEARILLQNAPIHIPYRRMYEHIFNIVESDYTPLDSGSVATFTCRLDGRHPTERIFWFFRNKGITSITNRLAELDNGLESGNGVFYKRMKFMIAGREREYLYEPTIWQHVTSLFKSESPESSIGSMSWALSNDYRDNDGWRQPEGTINFSTADRPTLFMELADVMPNISGQRLVELRVYTEGWCAYEVKDGRGRMMFAM